MMQFIGEHAWLLGLLSESALLAFALLIVSMGKDSG